MVMTVHKLSAGDGYTYLTRNIAGGDVDRTRSQDAAAYYTAEGNPPGTWIGRGAPLLGLAGTHVTEEQMRALFGHGMHPDADAAIARHQAAHIHAGTTDRQLARVAVDARRAARLGRAFPVYAALAPFEDRVDERLAVITAETGRAPTDAEAAKIRREEAARGRGGVAGYDVVFAPVKSAALLWALDPRPHVRQAVWDAHHAAKDDTLTMLEEHAAFTRTGTGGIAQIGTHGLVAVAFDHYDSRDGDPNLHTHVAISNKICGDDGVWRALDGRALYRLTVAASEHYNTTFQAALTERLGVAWTPRTVPGKDDPIHEITGIPAELIAHYSRRRNRLYARYETLLAAYRREHGHDPDAAVCHRLARQATLDTRHGKKPPRSLAAMRAAWTGELRDAFGPGAVARVMAAVPPPDAAPRAFAAPSDADVTTLAGRVLAAVAEHRATWTEWNVRAEAERLVRAVTPATTAAAAAALVGRVVAAALAPGASISVEAPSLVDEPAALRRADGTSVFVQHRATRYTSQAVLDAEQRLLTAARTATQHAMPADTVTAALRDFDQRTRHPLDPGQRRLVAAFATSDALLAVGIGAAGTGKTTAMRAYLHTARAHGRSVVPLATSAASAAVLAADLGVPAENLHKFLHDHRHAAPTTPPGEPAPRAAAFEVRPGDVILVDEAGMAGTFNLDRLRVVAVRHGAVIRLLGDHRQLAAVESGGVLRLIATDVGAAELETVHRFTDPAEAAATTKLRVGDSTALDHYETRNRIRGGSRHAMLDGVYTGWHADIAAGKVSIMCAAANRDVAALAARARLDRVTLGRVEPGGVALHDGNTAGRGDWVIARRNERRLTHHNGRDFVRNGDGWTVTARHRDGSLTVRHLRHRGTLRLPADYVAAHVELLYATTVHRAQGDTVDTTHALVTGEVARENLYVAATRARERTHLYTVTHELLDLDEDRRLDRTRYDPDGRAAREVLEGILATDTAELTATETIRAAQHDAASLATLMPRMVHAAEQAVQPHYRHLTEQVFGPAMAARVAHDPAWPIVVHTLMTAHQQGWQPEQLLAAATRYGPMDDARSAAQLLAWRLSDVTDHTPVPAPLAPPDRAQAARYAALLEHHTGTRPPVGALQCTPPALHNGTPARRTPDDGYTPVDAADLDHITLDNASAGDPARLEAITEADRRHLAANGVARAEQRPPETLRHHQAVTDALGDRLADVVRRQPGWSALHAAVARAHHADHDASRVLSAVAGSRSLLDAGDTAQVLACRLNRYLAAQPTPAAAERNNGTWATIGWILAGHERAGGDPDTLLAAAPGGVPLHDLAAHITEAAQAAALDRRDHRAVPPWTPPADASRAGKSAAYTGYLTDSERAIEARVARLADDAATRRPAWTTAFGAEPHDPQKRAHWRRQLGIAAAYRDQYAAADDDPRHPLGPYIEPGRAGYHAYWHAVDALARAHTGSSVPSDNATHRVAVDTYWALPEPARRAVATTVIGRVGILWQGDTASPDEAITQPVYRFHLSRALRDHGHLAPDPKPHVEATRARGEDARPSRMNRLRRPTTAGPRQRIRAVPRQEPAGRSGPTPVTEPRPVQQDPGPRYRL
ncbi:MobF family relaxase [Spirilliplanes yamanashiensis]|uniref:TrwC relaxase domain-containing protein n=1 Tax=Spirilliplanes yamanashiensis TaxID=42233 RepID=A0A8J4DLW5_9ACTN|nr:MobF family relaxase [Spirilliplanes yamanashiensis]MDP9818488.1 conjugative relaxase-like TrwC/TraI family protein [Spirilliplanes yamanashiensis]GIJ06386.1 hypothetical protein Sya03_57380 [Spirilliplanes yamanashiensis]